MESRIVVIGSSNTDMVIKSDRLPAPGETVLGGDFFMNPGGKGANQAVAAARLGGNVSFIGRTGDDLFGAQARALLTAEEIDTTFLSTDMQAPSGVALILLDQQGQNSIAVAPGANAQLQPAALEAARPLLRSASVVLLQLEIPLPTVIAAVQMARQEGTRVILNPAPAQALPDDLLSQLSIITPNETEAGQLTGIPVSDLVSAERAARALQQKGIPTVVITLGAAGALLAHQNTVKHIASPKVTAVDTTAAGDVFNGALAVALCEEMDMPAAVDFACRSAAISVTRLGAQAAAPYRKEVSS